MRTRFHKLTGVDPLVLYRSPRTYPNGRTGDIPGNGIGMGRFQARKVRQFLIDVRANLPRKSPPFLISAAVKPDPETGGAILPGLDALDQRKLIDLALPMNYTASIDRFENMSSQCSMKCPQIAYAWRRPLYAKQIQGSQQNI